MLRINEDNAAPIEKRCLFVSGSNYLRCPRAIGHLHNQFCNYHWGSAKKYIDDKGNYTNVFEATNNPDMKV